MIDFDFSNMEAQLAGAGADDIDDLSAWDTLELHNELRRLDRELTSRKELLHPASQAARDMHSRRGAIVVTLRKRGKL